MSLANITKSFLNLPYCYALINSQTNPCLKRKQMRKNNEKGVRMKSCLPPRPYTIYHLKGEHKN